MVTTIALYENDKLIHSYEPTVQELTHIFTGLMSYKGKIYKHYENGHNGVLKYTQVDTFNVPEIDTNLQITMKRIFDSKKYIMKHRKSLDIVEEIKKQEPEIEYRDTNMLVQYLDNIIMEEDDNETR